MTTHQKTLLTKCAKARPHALTMGPLTAKDKKAIYGLQSAGLVKLMDEQTLFCKRAGLKRIS